ncbi:hypothetical protein [Gordonia zhaorongruii]|uniref:hypothetical protein n=1 Tax=Gordonia zhaorongruii TaxID=2597659 RepID=UPI001047F136|nr:hypothetical protein [Gordonia zhaorongruii]
MSSDESRATTLSRLRTSRRRVRHARDELLDAEVATGGRDALGTAMLAFLMVTAVLAVTVACFAVWRYADAPTRYSDADYVDAATERVSLLVEADSTDPTRARRILSGATGDFHDSFAQSADAYTQFVAKAGTRGDGSVDGVAVARRDGDSALLLVAASVRVETAKSADDGGMNHLRMRVAMTPEDDVLKVSAVEVLQ